MNQQKQTILVTRRTDEDPNEACFEQWTIDNFAEMLRNYMSDDNPDIGITISVSDANTGQSFTFCKVMGH